MRGCVLICLVAVICSVSAIYPFQDPTKPWDDRVDDLVNRLTLEEVAGQTIADYGKPGTPAIPRLGIKPFVWITECIRGQRNTNTTAFPHSLGLSASWSPELIYNMTTAISYEVRAQWNAKRSQGTYKTFYGLSCFSPVINIARHPLWGRNQETYGEDPYLSGRMAQGFVGGVHGTHPRYMRVTAGCKHFDVHGGPENIPVTRMNFDTKESYGECPFLSGTMSQHFVSGLHGDHPRYMRVTAGCKHFDVHAGPENIPVDRSSFDAKVAMRDWRMTFLPAFKMCVDGGTYSLMCSYNSINGVPACANKQLLTDIPRGEWGFKGYIVSDAGAVTNINTQHHYTNNDIDTATVAIKAGTNLELGSRIFDKIPDAIKAGNLTEEEIREMVKPLFYTRMRLGEFDPEPMNPYNAINMTEVQSQTHRDLAIKAAQMTFTLLKNDQAVLPLKATVSKMAIVGPMADDIDQLYGDYGSNVVKQFAKTPREGLAGLADTMNYAAGCTGDHPTRCQKYDSGSVEQAVAGTDLVVVCLGTGQDVEAEGHDRAYLDLPGFQLDLLKDVVHYANGKPVIVLLFNAGPLDITWAKLHPGVHAIMACFFPAQSTGQALYNTLTGASPDANPAGRLSMTWPANMQQVPEMTSYTMEGRTYRYFKGEPLYPFGYGLSYTTFAYSGISASPKLMTPTQNVTVKVMVMNTGKVASDEVTQVYVSWANTSVPVPQLQLAGFQRHRVEPGQTAMLEFTVRPEQLAVWMDDSTWGHLTGEMTVYAGGEQPNQRTTSGSVVLKDTFTVKM